MDRTRVRTRVQLALAVPLVVGLLATGAPAAAAADPVSFLTMEVEGYSGQTYHLWFETPSGQVGGSGSPLGMTLSGSKPSSSASLDFGPPTGGTLQVGVYANALGTATETNPRIGGSSNSSGCGVDGGRFEILEGPEFNAESHITRFAATYEIDCGSRTLRGAVAINATVPIPGLAIDPDQLDFPWTDVGETSEPMTFSAMNLGTMPADIAIAVTGTNPESFIVEHACSSVAASTDCPVTVRFAPHSGGQLSAQVVFTSPLWGKPLSLLVFGNGTFATATNGTPSTAIVIGSLPFLHGAATAAVPWDGGCKGGYESIWYRYSSSVMRRIELDSTGSQGSSRLAVHKGTASAMTLVSCAPDPGSSLTFTAEPNTTYFIQLTREYPGESRLVLEATAAAADVAVEASGFALQYATFYPYVDRYRDTVAIKGVRNEKASVVARIYDSSNRLVRSLSVSTGTGAYSTAWNGKSTAGNLQPGGKYKVVQTVTDLWGNRLSDTRYVTLSSKRLYRYTFTKTIDAGAYAASGKSGTGSISRGYSRYTGGLRLASGSSGAAAVAYTFSLPTATVYESIRFKALGVGSSIPAVIGLQKWALCWTYDDTCVDPWASGPTSYAWATVLGNISRNVSSTNRARGYIEVQSFTPGGARWTDIRDVSLVVVYGVLR